VSFRLRVLALVSLVALTAIGATAYLAYMQASRQVTQSAEADRNTVGRVIDELTGYARRHGTWEGVAWTVRDLGNATGQRIKLVTQSGTVVVDTDTLAGWRARPVTDRSTPIDPRPILTIPDRAAAASRAGVATPRVSQTPRGTSPHGPEPTTTPTPESTADAAAPSADPPADRAGGIVPWDATLREIDQYRYGVRLAACLTRWGLAATAKTDAYGIPVYGPDPKLTEKQEPVVASCRAKAKSTDRKVSRENAVRNCKTGTTAAAVDRRCRLPSTSEQSAHRRRRCGPGR
jgi:hypothetical protein